MEINISYLDGVIDSLEQELVTLKKLRDSVNIKPRVPSEKLEKIYRPSEEVLTELPEQITPRWSSLKEELLFVSLDKLKGEISDTALQELIAFESDPTHLELELNDNDTYALAKAISKQVPELNFNDILNNLIKEVKAPEVEEQPEKGEKEVETKSGEDKLLPLYFHERLKKEIKSHKLTQRDLADILGINTGRVSWWCNGGK